jgi:hypothetical protein
MSRRTYVITFDSSDPTVDLESLKEFVRSSPDFGGWWNHIPFTFLVTSDLDAETLSEHLRQYTKNAKLLVMEVNPSESDGWLPKRSWTWIRRREHSTGPVPGK